MMRTLPISLHGGSRSTTTTVWKMLTASREGNLDQVKKLTSSCPALSTCQYDYTSPLHFAVREGHVHLVRELISQRALDPNYRTHPFLESLVTVADDRGYGEIAQVLQESLNTPGLAAAKGDIGVIDYQRDEVERQFENAVHRNNLIEVEQMLDDRPTLARNELSTWGEGVLAMPANHRNREMLELLMRYGARVPDLSKWGRAYYFKHYDVAAFLLDSGMNPNHMNWRLVTLLHDMAQLGDIPKARLLLDHGANIDPIDEEYRSTPLGLAVRWGQREMAAFLLERGADPNQAGAPWATPVAWAKKKGWDEIEAELRRAGAE